MVHALSPKRLNNIANIAKEFFDEQMTRGVSRMHCYFGVRLIVDAVKNIGSNGCRFDVFNYRKSALVVDGSREEIKHATRHCSWDQRSPCPFVAGPPLCYKP